MVLRAFRDALQDAFASRVRNAEGDYAPDPKANRFPEWTPPSSTLLKSEQAVSLTGLVDEWWLEAKTAGRTLSTYESYKSTFKRLGKFLGHDNATTVVATDIVAFKDSRLASGVSPKTVGDSDIAALRSVFDWAVSNLKVASNPAASVKVKRPKSRVVRGKGLEPEEATAVLDHATKHPMKRGGSKTDAARRWVPWLCAYTGARLGEMVQLRKQDLRQTDGAWVLTITPEAGTVKDKEVREVVLHEHLTAVGFHDFVAAAKAGYLFVTPRADGEVRGVWRACKNRVREFVREVLTDPNVAPNHGWRHAFKSVGREAGIADSVLDAICGHAPKSEGGNYGTVTLKAQANAMALFPRYQVEEEQ